jgi:LysR family glycine cleavage system transcriptional activator
VCSPRFLAFLGDRKPRIPADLIGLPLLHDEDRQDWALWFQAQNVADLGRTVSSGISFDDQTLLIRAAASHQGIALVTETLARAELSQGGLVRALDVAWPQEFAYWLVYPKATADQPKIVAFRDWLISERGRPARRAAQGRTP